MHKVYYPISGSNAVAATGTVAVRGVDLFTIGLYASGTAASPVTGTITIASALTPNFPYLNIYSNSFNGAISQSGIYVSLSGPIESLQFISSGNGSTFSAVVLGKYNAQV